MACCLTASCHYLDQCWLIIKDGLWHSHQSNFMKSAHELDIQNVLANYNFEITPESPSDKWVECPSKHPYVISCHLSPKQSYVVTCHLISKHPHVITCHLSPKHRNAVTCHLISKHPHVITCLCASLSSDTCSCCWSVHILSVRKRHKSFWVCLLPSNSWNFEFRNSLKRIVSQNFVDQQISVVWIVGSNVFTRWCLTGSLWTNLNTRRRSVVIWYVVFVCQLITLHCSNRFCINFKSLTLLFYFA